LNQTLLILLIVSLSCLIALCIGLFIRACIEPHLLDTDFESLPASPDSPISSKPASLNICFFSDLHAALCFIPDEKLLDAVFAAPADAILFGGDVCNKGKATAAGLERLSRIAARAKTLGIPCCAVRGNHDLSISREQYLASGFTLLENESVPLRSASGQEFLLIGLDDSGKKNRTWPEIRITTPGEHPVERRILMVHNPEYINAVEDRGFRYMLSGHFHGGQIYLPFNLEYRLLRTESLAREGIRRGVFEKDGVTGYISRGVGCVVFPLRLFSKPQITHISFRE
jgi:uncharacterized protein